jgi:hypothetical protein
MASCQYQQVQKGAKMDTFCHDRGGICMLHGISNPRLKEKSLLKQA